MQAADASLVFAIALGVGVIVQALGRHLRVPGIVLLLAAGVALGPDGLQMGRSAAPGRGAHRPRAPLSVAIILFEGGLNLEIGRLRREGTAIRRLVTVGALITGIGGSLAARFFMDWNWTQALLFGTIVIVTGPTVVTPICGTSASSRAYPPCSKPRACSSIPIGAFIAVLALEIAVAPSASAFTNAPLWLAQRVGFGLVAGATFGFLLAWVLRSRRIVPEGYENIVTMGGVVLLFAVCRSILPESGILATTIAGIVVGNLHTRVGRAMSTFEEQITVMLIGLLFVLLAASVRLADVQALGWGGMATVAALMFVVRARAGILPDGRHQDVVPGQAVHLLARAARNCRGRRGFPHLERHGGRGHRGRAGAPRSRLPDDCGHGSAAGRDSAARRKIAPPAGRPPRRGGHTRRRRPWARARERAALGRTRVVFLDSNAAHCNAAERLGYGVVFGNAFDEKVLARARLDQAEVAVGLTSNTAVNALFAQEARSLFGVPTTYVGVDTIDPGVTTEKIERERGLVLFDGPKDLGRWNVRFRHNEAPIVHRRFAGKDAKDVTAPAKEGETLSLMEGRGMAAAQLHRDKKTLLLDPGTQPQPGDIGAFVLHGRPPGRP